MDDSTGYSRDNADERRADIAESLAVARALIESALPFNAIDKLLDTAIDDVVRNVDVLRADESAVAFVDFFADFEAHTCQEGAWCYVCDQHTVARIEEHRRNEAGE